MKILDKIESGLGEISTNQSPVPDVTRAAVLVAVTRGSSPEILLTRRAAHLNSHGFQVAFPGGKWEMGDADLTETALRESWEEVGLDPKLVDIKGSLPKRMSRWGVEVYPFVGVVPESLDIKANPEEIDEIFMAPLAFFVDEKPARIDKFERQGTRLEVPVWHYREFEIWGLTALIIKDLLNVLLDL